MKATGIVRNVDRLGRIVIPSEIRKSLGVKETGGLLELFCDGDNIVLKKYEPNCIFCKSSDNLIMYKDKNVCRSCAKEMSLIK